MKVIQETGAAPLTSGGMETVNIGISDNAEDQLMILNVLSNTLYTDKIAAVLREYGCNAFDANVEAGRGDQPIEVRLPNKLDPTVAIRDFGFGMTEQQILHTFCKLGRSTKRSSNAFTGMLGIGSKAGFAYGDAFTVTTYAEGLKTIYNCYRDKGAPRMAKMHTEASDAPDGVEVKIPVRQSDISEFITKAERVFKYFKVRPIFHGAKLDLDRDKPAFSGTNWRYTGGGDSVAIMGNVGYDVSPEALGTSAALMYGGKIYALLKAGVEFDFNIGDLEVAANREGLQYRDHTKKAILAACQQVSAEIGAVFTAKISGANSLWEATKLYGEAFDRRGAADYYTRIHSSNLQSIVGSSVSWKGHTFKDGRFHLGNQENDPEVSLVCYIRQPAHYRAKTRKDINIQQVYTTGTDLIINDLPSKKCSPLRITGHFDRNPDTKNLVVFNFKTPAAELRYWKLRNLDGAPTINLSTVAPAVNVSIGSSGSPSVHRSKHSAKAFVLTETLQAGRDQWVRSSWWDTDTIDYDGAGVYVALDGFWVEGANVVNSMDGGILAASVRQMRAGKLLDGIKVHGIKTPRVPKLGKNWKTLREYLAAEVTRIFADKSAAQDLADFKHAAGYSRKFDSKYAKAWPVGSLVRDLLDRHWEMSNPKKHTELMEYMISPDRVKWVKTPTLPNPSVNLNDLEKLVYQRYPLLKRCPESANASTVMRAEMITYVQLIDK
jgi:hypothetical protein